MKQTTKIHSLYSHSLDVSIIETQQTFNLVLNKLIKNLMNTTLINILQFINELLLSMLLFKQSYQHIQILKMSNVRLFGIFSNNIMS